MYFLYRNECLFEVILAKELENDLSFGKYFCVSISQTRKIVVCKPTKWLITNA